MILNEKDQSIVAKLSKFVKEIEVEMLVNKEKKIVSWFFDGCFVDSASTILFPNESADQIYATIYFFNTNETVVFH